MGCEEASVNLFDVTGQMFEVQEARFSLAWEDKRWCYENQACSRYNSVNGMLCMAVEVLWCILQEIEDE